MKKWFKHDSFKQQHLLATKAKIRWSDRNFCHSARLKSATFEQALKIVTNLLGFYQLFRYFWGARGVRNFWPVDDIWPMISYECSCEIICIYDIHIWKYDQKLEIWRKNAIFWAKMCSKWYIKIWYADMLKHKKSWKNGLNMILLSNSIF